MTTDVARAVPDLAVARPPVRVRVIRPSDTRELERFYATLSPESRRTRFFSLTRGLSHAQSASFCTTDHDHQEGFVAVVDRPSGGHERIVGHVCLEPDGAHAAEVAIAVADAFQGHGIGRRLIAAGLAWAHREGIAHLTATMLADTSRIHRLLVGVGLPMRAGCAGAGVTEITMDLAEHARAA